jgi:hypothetical protein
MYSVALFSSQAMRSDAEDVVSYRRRILHLRRMRSFSLPRIVSLCVLAAAVGSLAQRQVSVLSPQVDTDGDGLSDALEQALLVQFAPAFMIGRHDCSDVPSEFLSDVVTPTVKAQDGTIYGQVFPAKNSTTETPMVEIHFYHLWRTDCGPHGHPLDTEHVAALVRGSGGDPASDKWKAVYWYAAAHENTVCDVSQISRASTLKAQDRGAKVWISPGKHASYLNETLCRRGCGADRCQEMVALDPARLINLGEPGHPMNASAFISSNRWPLAEKMQASNFPSVAISRLELLPPTDIAWFNPGRHPAQGVIAVSGSTEEAIAHSGRNTTDAISSAGNSTDSAISVAGDSTGNALQKSYYKTVHALGTSSRHVGDALHLSPKSDKPE